MERDHTMSKISQAVLAAIVIAAFIFSSGCSSIGQKLPSDVVKAAYMTANEGKHSEVEKYLLSEVINSMKGGLGALAGGMKGVWDEATRNGTIQNIEILREEVRGEGTTVYFRIHFKDGTTKDDDKPLIKENGQWKITIG